MKIKAVIFDMDGTIVDSPLDFDAIRREIGLPGKADILQSIAAMDERKGKRARAILEKHERVASRKAQLMEGAAEMLSVLAARGIKTALLTRNSSKSVHAILERVGLKMDAVVTRDDGAPKPSPEGIHRIAAELGVRPADTLMVGDYVFDVQTGRAAGARTAFIKNRHPAPPDADFVLERLIDILRLVGE